MATSYASLDALKLAVWQWLNDLITPAPEPSPAPAPEPACPIIWAKQSGIQPEESYITLNLIVAGVMEGAADATRFNVGPDGQRITDGRRIASLSINAYGENACNVLFDLKQLIETEISDNALEAKNLSLVEHTDVLDLSEVRETKFQQREQMDVRLGYTTEKISGEGNTVAVKINDLINGEDVVIGPTP